MPARPSGFSLVELLTVIAVIGLLVGILVPTTTAARTAARRARTKVQFGQWVAAMDQFRQEYGFYPPVDGGSGGKIVPDIFAGALTGQPLTATTPATESQLAGNVRRLRFYHISEGELSASRTELVDGFGNTDIAVIYDKNGDRLVSSTDGEARGVRGLERVTEWTPSTSDLDLSGGVRAGVIFYSAGNGTAQGDLVFSWK